ncbi:MAG: hypothetical protein HY725_14455, partial [Candidatus Rokubacteria bacterium]|nr:hypothetical protein [Candidatus Rokubacteria bacterium]
CEARAIPWIEFKKGERKDEIVQPYRDRFQGRTGVVLVGVAQERASGWTATRTRQGRRVDFTYRRKSVCVNHYYFYLIDPEWGPAFLKVCGYAPYAIKLCLNGHEWAKRQLRRPRIAFTALDNGFLTCADPRTLQAVCDRLSERDIEAFFARWLARLPLPLTPEASQPPGQACDSEVIERGYDRPRPQALSLSSKARRHSQRSSPERAPPRLRM